MTAAVQRKADYLPKIPAGASDKDKIELLTKYITQMWQKQIDDRSNIEKLLSLVNSTVSTKQIFELMAKINGHTSAMPDTRGENTDHDRRYLTIKNSRRLVADSIFLSLNGKPIVEFVIVGTDLLCRYDVNLGVGSPDWSGEVFTYPLA